MSAAHRSVRDHPLVAPARELLDVENRFPGIHSGRVEEGLVADRGGDIPKQTSDEPRVQRPELPNARCLFEQCSHAIDEVIRDHLVRQACRMEALDVAAELMGQGPDGLPSGADVPPSYPMLSRPSPPLLQHPSKRPRPTCRSRGSPGCPCSAPACISTTWSRTVPKRIGHAQPFLKPRAAMISMTPSNRLVSRPAGAVPGRA